MSMGVDWPGLNYSLQQDYWARTIILTPINSQPGVGSITGRGIFNTGEIFVPSLDGALISTNGTIVDILAQEWSPLPAQGDLLDVPDTTVKGGAFVISSVGGDNGGGEITLMLQKRESMLIAWNLMVLDYALASPAFDNPTWTVSP